MPGGSCGTANNTEGFYNTDFEYFPAGSIVSGLVQSQLGYDNTPLFSGNTFSYPSSYIIILFLFFCNYLLLFLILSTIVHSETSFYRWFRNSEQSINVDVNLTFYQESNGLLMYLII